MKEALLNRPWLLIVVGYAFAMTAWFTMVKLAVQHGDKPIPVATTRQR
jgi:hypothetical protein